MVYYGILRYIMCYCGMLCVIIVYHNGSYMDPKVIMCDQDPQWIIDDHPRSCSFY